VTGAHFRSAYELYAHVIVAEHRGLSDEKLATIVAGQRPRTCHGKRRSPTTLLPRSSAVAFCQELTYRAAVEQFGQHGAAELSYLVGLYCLVSVTLNTFDVPCPRPEKRDTGRSAATVARHTLHAVKPPWYER